MTLGWIYRGGLLTQWPMVNDRRRLSSHQCLQTIGLQVRASWTKEAAVKAKLFAPSVKGDMTSAISWTKEAAVKT